MITSLVLAVALFASPAGNPPAGDAYWIGQLDLDQAWSISQGEGVTVGLVDTGVDRGEPALAGKVLPGAEFPDLGAGSVDAVGHGTTMALLISGVAPKAELLPARLDGGVADANAAIRWVVDRGAHVLNLSLGAGGKTTAFDEGLRYAHDHDVVVVASAGDSDVDTGVTSPADRPGVLAVSAVDRTGRFRPDVSVAGPDVYLAAPGVDMTTSRKGETAPTSGTSQAAAIVSGVVALVRAASPDLSADDVVARLARSAIDAGAPGRDPQYGFGIVNPVTALSVHGAIGFPTWLWSSAAGFAVVLLAAVARRRLRSR